MNCERCGKEVKGDLLVRSGETPSGEFVIAMISTPDRDWICCDGCNVLLCRDCCQYPESGYCDSCIERYNLYDYLVENGLISPEKVKR